MFSFFCNDSSDDSSDDSSVATMELAQAVTQGQEGRMQILLVNRSVHKHFKTYATATRQEGGSGLTLNNLEAMKMEVARDLRVPDSVFTNFPVHFERFDFDGDGLLNELECTKLFRNVLRRAHEELGGHELEEGSVPLTTLDEKGYALERELGRGGQGIMYLCHKRGDDKPYCMKTYKKDDDTDQQDLIDEYVLMTRNQHERIAKTYEMFQDHHTYYLASEPYFGGDLTKLPKRAYDQGVKMDEAWWRRIFQQCLEGLAFLHDQAIMHCDIKEPNIMVKNGDSYEAPDIVLIDFGLAEMFASRLRGASGTPGYIPIETHETGFWFPRGDVFSMGVTFFQLMVGQVPSEGGTVLGVLQPPVDNDAAIVNAARSMNLPWSRFPPTLPVLRALLTRMLSADRRTRPKAKAALADPWFASSSNADHSEEHTQNLLSSARRSHARDELLKQLNDGRNLADLREVEADLRAHDKMHTGFVTASAFIDVLVEDHGISEKDAKDFSGDSNTVVHYGRVLRDALHTKQEYTQKTLSDLWNTVDVERSGRLPSSKVAIVMEDDAFDEVQDPIALLKRMGVGDEGDEVSRKAFIKVMLEDGHIGRVAQGPPQRRGRACC